MAYHTKVIHIRETKLSTCNPIYCENKYDLLGVPLNILDNHPNSGYFYFREYVATGFIW